MAQEQKGVVYATLNEYIRANRHILHYNYDPEGVPRLRIRPLDGRLIDWFHGPPDPLKPGEAPHSVYSYVIIIICFLNIFFFPPCCVCLWVCQ